MGSSPKDIKLFSKQNFDAYIHIRSSYIAQLGYEEQERDAMIF